MFRKRRSNGAAPPAVLAASLALASVTWLSCGGSGGGPTGGAPPAATPSPIGEQPAITQHQDQAEIDTGLVGVNALVDQGRRLFLASFNTLDGAGRPASTGTGAPRPPVAAPDNMNRISGPDANSCAGCHRFPFVGGGGGNSSNVFVLAEKFPLVNFDEGEGDDFEEHFLDDVGIERNTIGMFGAGYVELLAREMTVELRQKRDAALAAAQAGGSPVTLPLNAKGVDFGALTAFPDGSLDTAAVDGVDPDLVVRPFHQKGIAASLREFTNGALNQHHGMQSSERFGAGVDADQDGVANEMTVGDVTSLVVFQATLPAPGRVLPAAGSLADLAVTNGQQLFGTLGCESCHVPALVLGDAVFTEPGPFNPPGNLQPDDVPAPFAFDLTTSGVGPTLTKQPDGTVVVPLYSDLKRHDLGPGLDTDQLVQGDVPTSRFLTKRLWGMANEPPFLHHGRALTIREAIEWHGGEADDERLAFEALSPQGQDDVLSFLLTLRHLSPGEPSTVQVTQTTTPPVESPGIATHVLQSDIDSGVHTAEDLFALGGAMFDADLNTLDGAGRPESAGDGTPRPRRDAPQNFNRISGPDSNGCKSCHNLQGGSGGGDAVHNVFVRAETFPYVNFDAGAGDLFQDLHLDSVGAERATIGVFGSGFIELLAREMSVDLQAQRDQALVQALGAGAPVTVPLAAKGVSFGQLTAHPDGALDASGVVGVDADLVVKPFHQKGVTVSLREFTNLAMNQHHGLQSEELFGAGQDPDADGVVDELGIGDLTALSVYQAQLPVPGRILPSDPGEMAAVLQGEALFGTIGCAACHVPELVLLDPVFTEPGPFNPPGHLQLSDVPQPFPVDLTVNGGLPRLPKEPDGTVRVAAYTDLKRHDMGPGLAEPFSQGGAAPSEFLTKKLWGMANEPPYMHHGRALTITEAILMHGGEGQAARDAFASLSAADRASVIDFLKTLRVTPGAPLVLVQ